MFSCYRYTHVRGDDANLFPRLAWYFEVDGSTIKFTVTRCSPSDNFSYEKAKELLHSREFYSTLYRPDLSLVENAIEHLGGYPRRFEKMVVYDHHYIQSVNTVAMTIWELFE